MSSRWCLDQDGLRSIVLGQGGVLGEDGALTTSRDVVSDRVGVLGRDDALCGDGVLTKTVSRV